MATSLLEDEYELGPVLGQGHFATVRIGICKETHKRAALKIIPVGRMNRYSLGLVTMEVNIMRRIQERVSHPSVIQMLKFFVDETRTTLVLELLTGRELFDHIQERQHYTERHAAMCVKSIVGAVHALHGNGILHRDLKPENCIYDENDCIKVTDFGLGTMNLQEPSCAPSFHGENLVGTPGYIAPEVLDRLFYSPACDVWSVGVILFILLFGYAPFSQPNRTKLFEQIRSGRYHVFEAVWKDISEEAKDLVQKMLTIDTSRRIQTCDILAHRWIVLNTQPEVDQLTPGVHLGATLERLRAFNAKRKFRAAAMACVWGARLAIRRRLITMNTDPNTGKELGFSTNQLQILRRKFERALPMRSEGGGVDDTSAEGIDHERFISIMTEMGFGHFPLEKLFRLFDTDGNNMVDYKEFLVGLSSMQPEGYSALRFCFDLLDTSTSGGISRHQLERVLMAFTLDKEQGSQGGYELAEAFNNVFDRLDKNGDDKVSFEEFRDGISSEPLIVECFTQPLRIMFKSGQDPPSAVPDVDRSLLIAANSSTFTDVQPVTGHIRSSTGTRVVDRKDAKRKKSVNAHTPVESTKQNAQTEVLDKRPRRLPRLT